MTKDELQRDRLVSYLNNMQTPECPICRSKKWQASDTIWEFTEFNQAGFRVGGPKYPVIAIACTNCGNTLLLNALVTGIVKPEQKETEPEDKSLTKKS